MSKGKVRKQLLEKYSYFVPTIILILYIRTWIIWNMYLWMSFWQPVISSVFTARLQKKPNTSSMKKLSPK